MNNSKDKFVFEYHDVDVLLPAQEFQINFSYTTDQSIDVMNEMVLRLVKVQPMALETVANFLEVSLKDMKIVVNDLFKNDELTLTENNLLTLTKKSQAYFKTSDGIPKVATVVELNQKLTYELIEFTVLPKRVLDYQNAVKVNINHEKLTCSENIVRSMFQKQFNDLVEDEVIKIQSQNGDTSAAKIYKINEVRKVRDCSQRIHLGLELDIQGQVQPLSNLDTYEGFSEQTSNAIGQLKNSYPNFEGIQEILAETYSDIFNYKIAGISLADIFNQNSDSSSYSKKIVDSIIQATALGTDDSFILGPCYNRKNTEYILDEIKKFKPQKGEKSVLHWLTPLDGFWGKSKNFCTFIEQVMQASSTKGVKLSAYFQADSGDKERTSNLTEVLSSRDYRAPFSYVGAIEDSEAGIEVLALKNSFVMLIAHIQDSEFLPDFLTSFPVGVIIRDPVVVNDIVAALEIYNKPEGNEGFNLGKI